MGVKFGFKPKKITHIGSVSKKSTGKNIWMQHYREKIYSMEEQHIARIEYMWLV